MIEESVTSSEGKSGLTISPGVASGSGLMLFGGILIAIFLAMDRLSIYGIILICLGLFESLPL